LVASCWLFLNNLYYDARIREHQVALKSGVFFTSNSVFPVDIIPPLLYGPSCRNGKWTRPEKILSKAILLFKSEVFGRKVLLFYFQKYFYSIFKNTFILFSKTFLFHLQKYFYSIFKSTFILFSKILLFYFQKYFYSTFKNTFIPFSKIPLFCFQKYFYSIFKNTFILFSKILLFCFQKYFYSIFKNTFILFSKILLFYFLKYFYSVFKNTFFLFSKIFFSVFKITFILFSEILLFYFQKYFYSIFKNTFIPFSVYVRREFKFGDFLFALCERIFRTEFRTETRIHAVLMASFTDTKRLGVKRDLRSFLILFKVTTAPWRLHLFSPVVTCLFPISFPTSYILSVCPFPTGPAGHATFLVTSIFTEKSLSVALWEWICDCPTCGVSPPHRTALWSLARLIMHDYCPHI